MIGPVSDSAIRAPDPERQNASSPNFISFSKKHRNTEGIRINEDFFESGRQVREAGPLPDIPLVVLSAALDRDPVWHKLQNDLPNIVPRGRAVLAGKSGPDIHWDEPDLVISAIRDVVLEARNEASKSGNV